jgi:hypothetical protein
MYSLLNQLMKIYKIPVLSLQNYCRKLLLAVTLPLNRQALNMMFIDLSEWHLLPLILTAQTLYSIGLMTSAVHISQVQLLNRTQWMKLLIFQQFRLELQ